VKKRKQNEVKQVAYQAGEQKSRRRRRRIRKKVATEGS